MKKPLVVNLPSELTYQIVLGELVNSHNKTSFITEESEGTSFQKSSPGVDYENFPTIQLTIRKDRNHLLENCNAYLFVRPESLEQMGLFLKIGVVIEKFVHKGILTIVTCRAHDVQLKKRDTSTKQTWIVEEEMLKG